MRAWGSAMRVRAGAFAAFLLLMYSIANSEPLRLHVDWPSGWELRQCSTDDGVVHFRGREVQHGFVLQELDAVIVDLRHAHQGPTSAQLEDLAARQRARFSTDHVSSLEPFSNDRGHYFSARVDSRLKSTYTHVLEGVLYDAGYLINFALRTNAPAASRAHALLRALEDFEIR